MRPLAAVLLSAASLAASACASVPPGPDRGEAAFETRLPLPIVKASLDGGPPQTFILDTGSAVTFVKAGGQAPGPTTVGGLAVGGMVFRDVPVQRAVLPADLGAEGILSPQSAFPGTLIELDGRIEGFALRLYRGLDEAGWRALVGEPVHAVPLHWEDGVATVEARIGETALTLRLDSGSGGCTLPASAFARLSHGGKPEVTLPVAVGPSQAHREQIFALDGPGSVGFPWFLYRRAAITADRRTLLFTDRP